MACTRPLHAYKTAAGKVIVGKGKGGVSDDGFAVPCGQCKSCRLRDAQDKAVRCMHELQTAGKGCFITLTYDKAHLPDDLSIDMETWKKFAKRLRKRVGPFRFLMCGEYGDEGNRPHYHFLAFGIDFAEDRQLYSDKPGYNLYRSPTLEKAWPFGFSIIGDITFESASYVARYTMKKQSTQVLTKGDVWVPNEKYRRIDPSTGEDWYVTPEFSSCSRAYGLGTDWFHRYWSDVYPHDFVVVSGRKLRPPKFYDHLAEKLASIDMDAIKKKRRENAKVLTTEELEAKEICLTQRSQLINSKARELFTA